MAQGRRIRQQQMQVMPEIKVIFLLYLIFFINVGNYIHTAQSLICKMYSKLYLQYTSFSFGMMVLEKTILQDSVR